MLATCWQHAGNMLATCWQHAYNMLGTCWQQAGNMLAARLQHTGNMLATTGNMLATCSQHAVNMQSTCWQHSGHMLATCWQQAFLIFSLKGGPHEAEIVKNNFFNFSKSFKINSKNNFDSINRNKVKNFGGPIPYSMKGTDWFLLPGP